MARICVLNDGKSSVLPFYFIRCDVLSRYGSWKNTTEAIGFVICRYDPHLIIGPLSVFSSWQNKLPARYIYCTCLASRIHGTQSVRDRLKNNVRNDGMELDFF